MAIEEVTISFVKSGIPDRVKRCAIDQAILEQRMMYVYRIVRRYWFEQPDLDGRFIILPHIASGYYEGYYICVGIAYPVLEQEQ